MKLGLRSYRLFTAMLEPLTGMVLRRRVSTGKEDLSRLQERFGRTDLVRPDGRLVWLHGASVGETALLIDLFERLRARMPDVLGLFTSQTMTSAAMFDRIRPYGAIHQMAPVDGPSFVRRFLGHWRPDAFVLAEGEIWPNIISQIHDSDVPSALVNARMTQKTLNNWYARPGAAREVFGDFNFIGAADSQTAGGLQRATGCNIQTVGNLKQATRAPGVDENELAQWHSALADRPVLLAASTHAGEEEFAIRAFAELENRDDNPLLILAPRHPDRGERVAAAIRAQNLDFKQRSKITEVGCSAQVLLADTMGEMGLWMRLARSVYLGGANKPDVGGHNPIEPLKLLKPTFSGPHHFNFADLMERVKPFNVVTIGDHPDELAAFWRTWLDDDVSGEDWAAINAVFADVEQPLFETLEAIVEMLVSGADA